MWNVSVAILLKKCNILLTVPKDMLQNFYHTLYRIIKIQILNIYCQSYIGYNNYSLGE